MNSRVLNPVVMTYKGDWLCVATSNSSRFSTTLASCRSKEGLSGAMALHGMKIGKLCRHAVDIPEPWRGNFSTRLNIKLFAAEDDGSGRTGPGRLCSAYEYEKGLWDLYDEYGSAKLLEDIPSGEFEMRLACMGLSRDDRFGTPSTNWNSYYVTDSQEVSRK